MRGGKRNVTEKRRKHDDSYEKRNIYNTQNESSRVGNKSIKQCKVTIEEEEPKKE